MGNNQQRVSEQIPTLATCKTKKKKNTRYRQFGVARVIKARGKNWTVDVKLICSP